MPKTETKNCMFDCVWRGVCVCVCVEGGGEVHRVQTTFSLQNSN